MLDDPGSIKGNYGMGPLDPVVLFVGRMVGGMKGGDILIEAVPDILGTHGDAKILFVGDGDNKMHCDHRAKELNVEGSCRFLGSRSGEELVNLLLGTMDHQKVAKENTSDSDSEHVADSIKTYQHANWQMSILQGF